MPVLNFSHSQYKVKMIQRKARFDRDFPKHLDKTFPIESPLTRFNLAFKKSEKGSGGASTSGGGDDSSTVGDGDVHAHGSHSVVISDRALNDSQSMVLVGFEGSIVSAASGVGNHNSVLSRSASMLSNKQGSTGDVKGASNGSTTDQPKSPKRGKGGKHKKSPTKSNSSASGAGDEFDDDPFFFDDADGDIDLDDQRYSSSTVIILHAYVDIYLYIYIYYQHILITTINTYMYI